MGKLGTTGDVADAVAFLMSDMAGHITGCALPCAAECRCEVREMMRHVSMFRLKPEYRIPEVIGQIESQLWLLPEKLPIHH